MALLRISKKLTRLSKAEFQNLLESFYYKFGDFLNEKTRNEDGKEFYTHKRLRSAYFSLKRNINVLFTFGDLKSVSTSKDGDYIIPNTNNKLESCFNDLKTKLRNHRGLNLTNKKRFISWYFWEKNNRD